MAAAYSPGNGDRSPAANAGMPGEGEERQLGGRLPGGGPAGRAPLVRALRAKQPDVRRVVSAWHDRFEKDHHAAVAELVSLVLVVADVRSVAEVAKEDIQDREPSDVVQQLVATLAMEAAEKGADFTQHWLVSRERGAQRVRENYPAIWRELAVSAPPQTLLDGLLQLLRDWTLALADCQFRSVRHSAVVAALHLVEGLGLHQHSLQLFCGTAALQIQDAEVQRAAGRAATLAAEHDQAQLAVRNITAARDALGVSLLSRRTKDVDPEVRRSCFEALRRWAASDAETFLKPQWTRYLHFGLSDRDAKARAAVLGALNELFRCDPSVAPQAVQNLVEHVRPRVVGRCHDVDPAVGAEAIRCVVALAARDLLAEAEMDAVIDLVWDKNEQRSREAATFASRFVLAEDVIDYPRGGAVATGLLPIGAGGGATARRRLLMLCEFIGEYTEGRLVLTDRLVAALWRRATCLEDWETIAGLLLPGGEHVVTAEVHAALVHLAEATLRLAERDAASKEGSGHAEGVLDRAARALAGRLHVLLAACQADASCMRRAVSLCRHILSHCACGGRRGSSRCDALFAGPHGESLAECLKVAFLRQPDPETLEHVAEAFAHLLDLADSARPVVVDLATALHTRMMELAPSISAAEATPGGVPPEDALVSVAARLRILAKAFDVSLGRVRSFYTTVLGLLDDRSEAIAAGRQPTVGPRLAVALLELLALVLTRHAAALIQPDPLPHCVVHDPVDLEELQMAPTAANDLCRVAVELLRSDPMPQVRTAALASSVALLTAWSNAVRFTDATRSGKEATSPPAPWLNMDEELADALCGHLGELLTEANEVPADNGHGGALPVPGDTRQASAFSELFAGLQEGASSQSAMTDSQRVRTGILACTLVGACQHPDVADSAIPAVVLTQGLSAREDLQQVAWGLLGRLRREAHSEPETGESFFKVLLHAVHMVHRDAGIDVARDLSSRLLHHVAVGKLSPSLQAAFVVALQAGIEVALSPDASDGFLGVVVPWVTKHLVEDGLVRDLAAWAEAASANCAVPEGLDRAQHAARAGLPVFLQACRTVTGRATRPAETPARPARGRVEVRTPTAALEDQGGAMDVEEAAPDEAADIEAAQAADPHQSPGSSDDAPLAGARARAPKRRRTAAAAAARQ